jgi:hypothetical protein
VTEIPYSLNGAETRNFGELQILQLNGTTAEPSFDTNITKDYEKFHQGPCKMFYLFSDGWASQNSFWAVHPSGDDHENHESK